MKSYKIGKVNPEELIQSLSRIKTKNPNLNITLDFFDAGLFNDDRCIAALKQCEFPNLKIKISHGRKEFSPKLQSLLKQIPITIKYKFQGQINPEDKSYLQPTQEPPISDWVGRIASGALAGLVTGPVFFLLGLTFFTIIFMPFFPLFAIALAASSVTSILITGGEILGAIMLLSAGYFMACAMDRADEVYERKRNCTTFKSTGSVSDNVIQARLPLTKSPDMQKENRQMQPASECAVNTSSVTKVGLYGSAPQTNAGRSFHNWKDLELRYPSYNN